MSEEARNKAAELTDEEAGKAAGGMCFTTGDPEQVSVGYHVCENCGHRYEYTCYGSHTSPPKCPKCGYNPVTHSF